MIKYYIWLNIASRYNYYWNQRWQDWTAEHTNATIFDNLESAEMESIYAENLGFGEAIIKEKLG